MRRIRSNYELQVHKVTSGEVVHNFVNNSWFLCHVATWTSHVATSFLILSATSRREFSRRDVKLTSLCNVVTCIFTSRRQFVNPSVTSRRVFSTSQREFAQASVTSQRHSARRDVIFTPLCDVATWDSNVATWIEPTLCHVATLPPTSRRCLVKLSVTSRRDPARRDVTLFLAQEWFILALHLTHPHSSKP